MTVATSLVEELLYSAPERDTCIVDQGRQLSYGDLDRESSRLANKLGSEGIKSGDRVSIYLPNSWHFVVAFFGVLRTGAIPVLVDFRSTERELEFFFKDSQSSLLISDVSKENLAPSARKILFDSKSDAVFPVANRPSDQSSIVSRNSDDVMCLVYTGGTTGRSKGAMLSFANFRAVLSGLKIAWRLEDKKEVFAQILPMTHSGGLNCGLNSALFNGGVTVILRKFDPEILLKTIPDYKITAFSGVPTVFNALVNSPLLDQVDLSSLRICFCSGAPVPEKIVKAFKEKTGIAINVGWG